MSHLLFFLPVAASAYTLLAVLMIGRYRPRGAGQPIGSESVTLLKPLYGAELRLLENLESFIGLEMVGPVELVCGVQRPGDPALAVVADLQSRNLSEKIVLVEDSTSHGSNGKISNLINMAARAQNDLLILSDSDMAVPKDYLRQIVMAIDKPGVGAVTCPYAGRGDAGFWSEMAAGGVSYSFLPSVVVGAEFGLAHPCMGSTIALRRDTLKRIGGFEAFADILADDYAIGRAVRDQGLKVALAPMILTHASCESAFGELWRHELRWHATVRDIDPAGYFGSFLTHPLPIALLLSPWSGWAPIVLALAARVVLKARVDEITGRSTLPLLLLPLRDCLGFVTFVGGFFTRSVDWRGARLKMVDDGRISAGQENF